VPAPIAFVSRLPASQTTVWLDAFAKALPEAEIRPLQDIRPDARAGIEIAIVANPDPADLRTLRGLKWIHSVWAGVETIVIELWDGAPVLSRLVDPEMSRTMAEAVLAWSYYLQLGLPAYAAQQRQKQWIQLDYHSPHDVTVGLLGLGQMGMTAAVRLKSAGFSVIGLSQFTKDTDFDTFAGEAGLKPALQHADILVCLLPLTFQTQHILNADTLAALPHGASVINFGRGGPVDTHALTEALNSVALSHAVLDVFEREPLPVDSGLWEHPHITILPHISAITSPKSATQIVARNIRDYWETGLRRDVVDIKRGY
jgi:glyoxylate/hydroxypyruvate reductase A